MSVLVTGGAGYIGSHIVRMLRQSGDVVVVDNFSTGDARRLADTPVRRIDLASEHAVRELCAVMREFNVDAVIHMAALKQVGESVEQPIRYYRENMSSLATVLEAMTAESVPSLVFSSSAAVYGSPQSSLVSEDEPTAPVNPYGASKLAGEWLVKDVAQASSIRAVSLRYFNVAGAGEPALADTIPANLVTLAIEAVVSGREPQIYGDDYDTPDGTGVRDYVHVNDLASAHIAAIDFTRRTTDSHTVFNVGTGTGASVREVLAYLSEVSGNTAVPRVVSRRAGDPASVVADSRRITAQLGWSPQYSIKEMVESAWNARVSPPV
ncbi:UDP-glucose 4-epimerase GalE [Paramicrobacterium chengjingii]|uniref:UDP-glucose 4-epimerase n=1 Tax=Paramicrobacterium chengjingii TaxID=2769067 RepID=A0ABX6YKX7_9MICO|nr:UDP-glucose 4-epimerase GalE [Microbacterium chengjingii]QPZ39402.1 UDP-glucose 4-epimerase GalE [Microbacterium chengjingii]